MEEGEKVVCSEWLRGKNQLLIRSSFLVVSDSLQLLGLQPARFLCPYNFPGKNSGVGCHFLLQGIFPTQGLNPGVLCLLHCCRILPPEPSVKPVTYGYGYFHFFSRR